MKYLVIVFIILCSIVYLTLGKGDEHKIMKEETLVQASNPSDISNKKHQAIENDSILPSIYSNEMVENPKNDLTQKEAAEVLVSLFGKLTSFSELELENERRLVAYLRKVDDRKIYDILRMRFDKAVVGTSEGDKILEYGLSLLAAVNTRAATELLLEFVSKNEWENSEAIYLVKKSISHLNKSGHHSDLMKRAFATSKDTNPFLKQIAKGITNQPTPQNVDYLFSYISGNNNTKNSAAIYALNSLNYEPIVPTIKQYIGSEMLEQKEAALNALANMGQYEAASALIYWGALQPIEQKSKVKVLFDIAVSRSPSTIRAIKKEATKLTFASDEIRTLILSYITSDAMQDETNSV